MIIMGSKLLNLTRSNAASNTGGARSEYPITLAIHLLPTLQPNKWDLN